jgi:5-hydroxyisourate hydrolase-like protein (transthyretin family)
MKNIYLHLAFGISFFLQWHGAFSKDSLYIKLSQRQLQQGDTLHVVCANTAINRPAATLHVWIENTNTHQRWRYRFPMVNNKVEFSLLTAQGLPDGTYALSFVLQSAFLKLQGVLKNRDTALKEINMLVLHPKKESHLTRVKLEENGQFNAGKFMFEDTANIIFNPPENSKANIDVQLQTWVDSLFVPETIRTELITVAKPGATIAISQPYALRLSDFISTGEILPEVTLVSKKAPAVKKLDREITSGPFRTSGKLYDGYSTEMERSVDVVSYIASQIVGLNIEHKGMFITIYRKQHLVNIFINEFQASYSDLLVLHPHDIAMIKVFEPNEGPSILGGGAIAIYTRTAPRENKEGRRNEFKVFGYTPALAIWQ